MEPGSVLMDTHGHRLLGRPRVSVHRQGHLTVVSVNIRNLLFLRSIANLHMYIFIAIHKLFIT
jgi:hypothetical protein